MTKAKKQELTLEKKLEHALITENEQPYEVPKNWVWTKLDSVALYKKGPFGSSITKAMFVPKGIDTYKVYEQGNAIRKDINYGTYYISQDKYNELKGFKVESGDLIVSCAGTIGETYQLPENIEPGVINQALMKVKVNSNISLDYFLFYFDQILREDITGHSKGTAIKNIPPFSVLKNMTYPLPPLAEQQRIVDRIESLFEKLDKAKELAQNSLDTFEARKAAIFHKAFTGELTAKWRGENSVVMDSWKEYILGDLVDTKYGYTESAHSDNIGPKFLRITDIQDNTVDWSTVPYCPIADEDYMKYKLNIGDIVVARTGATTGKSYLIHNNVEAVYASYLIRINIFNKDKLTEEYLYYFMQSTLYWSQITEFSQGIAQPGVNANKLKDLVIPVPLIQEQQKIIKILDNLFEKEQKAKELCDIIDKIDLIKKTILVRAFRGQLGTNDPKEESSIDLLKECL